MQENHKPTFTEAEFYQVNFDARVYTDSFYSNPDGHPDENDLPFLLGSLRKTFTSGDAHLHAKPLYFWMNSSTEWWDQNVLYVYVKYRWVINTLYLSSGKHSGQRLIDIGTGPSIHSLISASEHYEDILVSDYTDSNRQEIKKWLKDEEGCFDWLPVIQYVCNLGGQR